MNDYQAISRELLDQQADPVLQEVVQEARAATGFPIALVTLVLRRTQMFRAHIGLPKDLASVAATDRCISFCQYVVKSGKPLKIIDAKAESTLPQQLVDIYNIRAYAGIPVKVEDQVVGSLCVIDSRPNSIPADSEKALAELAEKASRRLTELSRLRRKGAGPDNAGAAKKATLRAELAAISKDLEIALAGMLPVTKAIAALPETGNLGGRSLSVLKEALQSFDDMRESISALEKALEKVET